MADQVRGQRDYEKAIKFMKEALVYNENDSKVMSKNIKVTEWEKEWINYKFVLHLHISAFKN